MNVTHPQTLVRDFLPGTWCVWDIKAPPDHAVLLRFLFFHFERQDHGTLRCATGFLEIRAVHWFVGE
ncbi:hypothetical protein SK128_020732, partial [Halocaridina rubra]